MAVNQSENLYQSFEQALNSGRSIDLHEWMKSVDEDEAHAVLLNLLEIWLEFAEEGTCERPNFQWIASDFPRHRDAILLLKSGYRVHQVLGKGGMGSVYLAEGLKRDCSEEYRVAIKVCGEPSSPERFQREVEILRTLKHQALPEFINDGEIGGRPFLVMEYIDGCNLKELLPEICVDPEVLASIFSDICAGLAQLHQAKFIHRDIKPENIMVRGNWVESDLNGVLVDLGIAKSQMPESTQLTQTGEVPGTPARMAPEQKSQQVSEQTDVWGVGNSLQYALEKGRLHSGNKQTDAKRDALDCVARWCLSEEPSKRYTVGELVANLNRVKQGSNIQPPARVTRSRWLIAAGLLLVISFGGVLFGASFPKQPGPDDPNGDSRAEKVARDTAEPKHLPAVSIKGAQPPSTTPSVPVKQAAKGNEAEPEQPPAEPTPPPPPTGFVIVYDDHSYNTNHFKNLDFKRDVRNFKDHGFGDKTSSIRWKIPSGWYALLYEDDSFRKARIALVGEGAAQQLDNVGFGDELSSLKWGQGPPLDMSW